MQTWSPVRMHEVGLRQLIHKKQYLTDTYLVVVGCARKIARNYPINEEQRAE